MAHIFVVDDDEQLLRMVGWILERGGHEATLISNPVEALDRIRAGSPDMAILDVMMPGMNGYDLCRQLRIHDETQDLPVLILTARSQKVDQEAALESGADDFLSKPVTSQELLKHIDNLLSNTLRPKGNNSPQSFTIALYSLKGGAGRTTLAVNLALSLRAASNAEVCLVDFSTSGGQAAMQMRVQSEQSWGNLLSNSAPSWQTVQEQLYTHESGMRLLTAPAVPQDASAPSAALTENILKHLQENMLFTVIDLPAVLNDAMKGAMAAADMGLHVITPDVVAVQTAVRTDRALHSLNLLPKERSYILNHRNAEVLLPKATIERGLNTRIPIEIRYDKNQARALSQGTPLSTSTVQSPLPVSLRMMAEALHHKVMST